MRLFFRKQKDTTRQPHLMAGQEAYTFRRSRTLTGTTSSKVIPTAEARSQLKTPRLKEHELRQKKSRIVRLLGFMIGVSLLLVLAIASFIGNFDFFYQQPSTTTPPTASYQESLRQYFAGRPLERFGFSLNVGQLEQFMREQHREIATLRVTRAWYGGKVQFVVTFRQPLLVWQNNDKRFFVDEQGVAFAYDHFGKPLVAVVDQSGITPDATSSVASRRFIRFLGKMTGAVNASGQGKVISVIIPTSTREIDLKLESREYPIKTHIDRDPLQQAEDIANALRYFDGHKIKPAYVDVRVAGKAYFK